MKALIFDVDDTLYDQLEPFYKAVKKYGNYSLSFTQDLFKRSRKFSDEVFNLTESGEMSIEDMHQFRIQKAFKDVGIDITTQDAQQFQRDYEQFQQEITLKEEMKQALELGKAKGVMLGIITNGPKDHQTKKIQNLGLANWIKPEHILISSAVGFAKPEKEIFQLAEERMGLRKEEMLYIGDSFENDVIGAKQAGWQVVWLNHRNRLQPIETVTSDFIVKQGESLYELLKDML